MPCDFESILENRRIEIEGHLSTTLQKREGFPQELFDAMRYSLLAPGKRLRPMLVLFAWEACHQDGDSPWPAAMAVEMVHVYSLIHDDLPAMDDDDLRRGQLTCHRKFGEATAILAGDALLTLAFEILAEGYPSSVGAACCSDLARAAGCSGMVGGQMDDLAWERSTEPGTRQLADLEFLHKRKTGALIQSCLWLGARTAFARKADHSGLEIALRQLGGYGEKLGLAFQITDDLLDVEGQASHVGKRVGKDAAKGKLTYPGLLGIEESRERARQLGEDARTCLAPFGSAASHLAELVTFVLNRNR